MRKKVLITGGGKRIGAALVRAFAENGWQVCIHVNRSTAEAAGLIAQLPNPDWHSVTQCDFSLPENRQAWLKNLECFDLIIANASCYRLTGVNEEESPENRQRYWQVNYHAVLELIEFQQKNLPENRPASAIIMLDCDVLNPDGGIKEFTEVPPGVDSYLASRIALAHQLPGIARRYAPDLRINAIAPGPVLPPVNCATKGMTVILNKVPMHRPAAVEDIVSTALFLQKNTSMTGSIIAVDGGMHLGVKNPERL
ncbi:MAG: SDR family oxidoreductase [Lentisphaeria bacterium]|nr:SDR family oxidoreductase [Lentisphaeria bacterium]